MRIIITAATALLAVMLAAGCESGSGGEASPAGKATAQSAGSGKTQLGTPVTLQGWKDGVKITVTPAKVRQTVRSLHDHVTPAAGNRYAAVWFTIRSAGTAVYEDNGIGAEATGAGGQSWPMADVLPMKINAGAVYGPSVNATRLAPGGMRSGWIVFELPEDVKVTGVRYTPEYGNAGTSAEWQAAT